MTLSAARPASFRHASFRRLAPLGVLVLAGALAGCKGGGGELVVDDSVGVTALRSPCPVVGIPEMTGDITLMSAPGRTDAGVHAHGARATAASVAAPAPAPSSAPAAASTTASASSAPASRAATSAAAP